MKIEAKSVRSLKLNPDNPRKISDKKLEQLMESLQSFPQMMDIRPVVIDENNMVLGGNMRLLAAKKIGLKSIPTIKAADLTEAQKKEFIIKDNAGFGEWEWAAVKEGWGFDVVTEWGIDIPRHVYFSTGDIEEDDFEIPDNVKTKIKPGDLIEIGPHRLLCGDATEIKDYEKLMGDARADLVLTDPPYNVDYTGKTKDKLKIDNDKKSDAQFYDFLLSFYACMAEYTKAGSPWYVWHADSEGKNFRKAMEDAGIQVKQCLVWKKNSIVMGRQDYHWQHEPCLYGWKTGAAHPWYADRKQSTLLEFDRPSRSEQHPTMKPIPLIGYQMANSSKAGDIVVDPFLGSGSTMLAAEQSGRICYGMELSPKYCQVIIDRLRNYSPLISVKINGKDYFNHAIN